MAVLGTRTGPHWDPVPEQIPGAYHSRANHTKGVTLAKYSLLVVMNKSILSLFIPKRNKFVEQGVVGVIIKASTSIMISLRVIKLDISSLR